MLPNVSKLRVSSRRRPQRGRLVRKPTEPTEGKIPGALMGTLEERKKWHMEQVPEVLRSGTRSQIREWYNNQLSTGKLSPSTSKTERQMAKRLRVGTNEDWLEWWKTEMPDELRNDKNANRAFWWFRNNPDDPDTQDVVTFDSLAEGYEPNDQWNAHFWFWTGETKKILVPMPLPQGTMPNPEEWVDAHSVIDVPEDWRKPGPKALVQVAPTRPGMPGEFVHKGALLLQFAMQRRNEPWGVWVSKADGTATLVEYPFAYRGPGGTGRDLFVPLKDGPQGQHHAEMQQIMFDFLGECYTHKVRVNGERVEGVRLYDLKNDAEFQVHEGREKQPNPFPTPWKWGGGTRPSHYDETGFKVTLQRGYARSSYGDDDLYQNENPWHDESDDEAEEEERDEEEEEGEEEEDEEDEETEDEDMENPTEQARQDIQELAVLARKSGARTLADFMFGGSATVLVERLVQMSRRLDDPIYTDMIADGMHDDLWEDFKDVVVHTYRLFIRLFDWEVRWQRDEIQTTILVFLHAASGDRAMADWIKFMIEPKLEALRLWRARHDSEDIEMHTVVTQLLEYIGISETQFAAEPMWQSQSKVDIYNFDAAVKDWMRGQRLKEDWDVVRANIATIEKNTSNNNANDPDHLYSNNLHHDDAFRRTLAKLCEEVFSSTNTRTTNNRQRAAQTVNFLTSVLVQTHDERGMIAFLTSGSTLLDDLRARKDYLASPGVEDLNERQRFRQIRNTDYLIKLLLNEGDDEEPTPQPPAPAPAPPLRRNSSDGYQTRLRTRQRREQGTGAALRRPGLLPRFFL